jgi:hypothetical protein
VAVTGPEVFVGKGTSVGTSVGTLAYPGPPPGDWKPVANTIPISKAAIEENDAWTDEETEDTVSHHGTPSDPQETHHARLTCFFSRRKGPAFYRNDARPQDFSGC